MDIWGRLQSVLFRREIAELAERLKTAEAKLARVQSLAATLAVAREGEWPEYMVCQELIGIIGEL